MEQSLERPEGVLVAPHEPCGTGVLVLAGSSGRVEAERARLFARHGALALSIRWFGGEGQQPDTYEVPLELFFGALDRLAPSCDRLAVVGSSFGAEAALLTAVHDGRVDAVVALAPSPVVWAGVAPTEDGEGVRQTSHWTLGGAALPFVPLVDDWAPDQTPPAFRGLYVESLASQPQAAADAAIPVERIGGEVLVVGGEDDQVWPGAEFARAVASAAPRARPEHHRGHAPARRPPSHLPRRVASRRWPDDGARWDGVRGRGARRPRLAARVRGAETRRTGAQRTVKAVDPTLVYWSVSR